MLSRWHVEDFKSIGGSSPTVALFPITLLVGANSSGKSSFIQTILLLKQTFQYASSEKPVLLNGPLLRLGNFYDVKNALSASKSFSLGFTIIFKSRMSAVRSQNALVTRRLRLTEIKCDLTVGLDAGKSSDELSLLQPFVRRSEVQLKYEEGGKEQFASVTVARARRQHQGEWWDLATDRAVIHQLTDLRIKHLSDGLQREIGRNRPRARHHGALPNYLFPTQFLISYDQSAQQMAAVVDRVINPAQTFLGSSGETPRDDLLEPARDCVLTWLQSIEAPDEYANLARDASDFDDLGRSIYALTHVSRSSQKGLLGNINRMWATGTGRVTLAPEAKSLQEMIEARVKQVVGDDLALDISTPVILSSASEELKQYFSSKVRYLGPLREPPKPLYPLEALSDPTDIGYRGEHTAAVLDLNKSRQIRYIRPPQKGRSTSPTTAPLQTAVVSWLNYMDLVQDVETGDRGKFGRELQVRMSDVPKSHDLTNVGVGVSQVLPIVVMALLAPEDSVLVLEQPELHLHPRVQTRLGDFLLSLAQLGKQCIIETHSEHLIYRLRRRVAESEDETLADLIGLYFVERVNGETDLRPSLMSRFGAINDWPSGFFDESQTEAESIVLAASEKRQREKVRRRDVDNPSD